MKFSRAVVTCLVACSVADVAAFIPGSQNQRSSLQTLRSAVADETTTSSSDAALESLTNDLISKLRFREAKAELEKRQMDSTGTFSDMKNRLRQLSQTDSTAKSHDVEVIDSESLNKAFANTGINFQDESDPDFEFNDLVRQTLDKAEKNHWKAATRKLKKLSRRYGKNSADPREIPEDVYVAVLNACMEDRLHGARAAEPARKIMESMVEAGYEIPAEAANSCLKNSMGDGPSGTHDGFGGIDSALAMIAAVESSETPIELEESVYSKLITVLAEEGSFDESLRRLRELVAERSETPPLGLFADVASACASNKNSEDAEKVMTVMAYSKAAGYELDNIASTVDGRSLLAAGLVAAEQMDNIGLGLRFLTAASKAEGCDPDRGDILLANTSPASQRACTIIHRQAIRKASEDGSWKLSVKLLELMIERGLTPSPSTLRSVVLCCAKAEKSRKATSILMDWVELSKQGRADKPPLRVFNTVVNACEVCGEEELTVQVLDAMQETHETDGNLVTFNIALKRLAKQGNFRACEGIIIGMLQNEIEPSVVTYTTAIAACVADPKHSDIAVEWISRMKSRLVQPNVITYNTAFASCLDGTFEGTVRASKLASEMVADIQKQVDSGVIDQDEYTNIIPNFYTRTLARQLMKQLKSNWEEGLVDKQVAKTTIRVPLLQVVEFLKTDLAEFAEQQKEFVRNNKSDDEESHDDDEDEDLEYSAAISTHRAAAV